MVTFINCFEVPAGRDEDFLVLWGEVNAYMAAQPGYVDHRLHRAVSQQARYRFVNVAHWDSADAWRAAHDDGSSGWSHNPAGPSSHRCPRCSSSSTTALNPAAGGPIPPRQAGGSHELPGCRPTHPAKCPGSGSLHREFHGAGLTESPSFGAVVDQKAGAVSQCGFGLRPSGIVSVRMSDGWSTVRS